MVGAVGEVGGLGALAVKLDMQAQVVHRVGVAQRVLVGDGAGLEQVDLALDGLAHPMGVEANLFSPDRRDPAVRARLLEMCDLPESAHLLMGVGRLSAEKRWPMVIDAVTAASQRHPIGLVLLGAGSQRARILKRIAGNPHIRLLTPERNRQRFARHGPRGACAHITKRRLCTHFCIRQICVTCTPFDARAIGSKGKARRCFVEHLGLDIDS